jgi:hypothetical protein
MEALKTKGMAKDGVLIIHVPEEFEGRNLEVIVLPEEEQPGSEVKNNTDKNQKLNRLFSVIGTAKDMNKNFDKHEVYDQ